MNDMNRVIKVSLALLAGVGLTWFFPLFRIVPLEQVLAAKTADFNAVSFVREFWDKQLVPTFEQAHDASEVVTMIKADPESARKTFGKSVGIGRVYFYFLRGEGTIVSVEKSGVAVNLIAPDDEADVAIKTGLIFGNAIRDATGQLRASDYANSQDYNDISKELNHLVQTEVLPILNKEARPGRKIRFVACAEVRESNKKLLPLTLVPLEVKFPE
jgi:predicted lipoprotein